MPRVLPDARFVDLDLAHPIFHSFFEIKSLDVPQYYDPPPADLPRRSSRTTIRPSGSW